MNENAPVWEQTLTGCGEAYRGISGQRSCSVGQRMSASATTAISWIATLRSESACDTGEVCPAARQSNAMIECCVDCKLIQTQCVENDGSVAATIAAAVLLEKMTHSCKGIELLELQSVTAGLVTNTTLHRTVRQYATCNTHARRAKHAREHPDAPK